MALEGLAVGVAKQAGAVVDFRGNIGVGTDGLKVGDGGEPLAECGLVGSVGQAEKVGGAVVESVGPGTAERTQGRSEARGLNHARWVSNRSAQATTPMSVREDKKAQQKQQYKERDDACKNQARRTRLCVGSHAVSPTEAKPILP